MTDTVHADEHREYNIAGMTCAHCASAVREQVAELASVRSVDIEVAAGQLRITGTGIDDDAIRAAVAEAGYKVV